MIGIVIAMEDEFKNISKVAFEKVIDITNRTHYKTYLVKIKEINFRLDPTAIVVISGVGKVNAAGATQYLIDRYLSDKIINIGVCGATEDFYLKSNTVVIDEVFNNDFDTSAVDGEKFVLPRVINQLHKCNYFPLYTQDHFVTSNEKSGYFDMEGYAVAQICEVNKVNFELIKSVTDVIKSGKQDKQYGCNYEIACIRSANKLVEIMNIVED